MERKFKGIWIPAELWNYKELTLQEKCMVAEIDSFKEFFMSNKTVGDFLGVSKSRAKQIIMGLNEKGIIDVNIIKDPETGQVLRRTIKVSYAFKRAIFEKSMNDDEQDYCPTMSENCPTPMSENCPTLCQKTDSNITNIDNKSIYIKEEADKAANTPKKKVAKKFIPPTVSQVRDYCIERCNSIDPDSFVDFYESKGWRVGNQSMKDWKAAVRTWERREKKKSEQPRRLNRAERQRLEDAELERMCREYDSGNGQTNTDDIAGKLSR